MSTHASDVLGSYGSLVLARAESGALRLAGPDDAATGAQLSAIEGAHGAIDSPFVPRPLAGGNADGQRYLELDCNGASLLPALIDAATARGAKLSYAGAIAFNDLMLDALEAAHAAPGGPYCLGAMSWDNFVIDGEGAVYLIGFGANFPRLSPRGITEAPELVLGTAPSPPSDVYVAHAIMRSLLPYVELHEMFERAKGIEGEVRELFASISSSALAAAPEARLSSIAELRARYREVRSVVQDLPEGDLEELAQFFVGLAAGGDVLHVDRQARVVTLGHQRIDLSKQRAPWAIFNRLVEQSFSSLGPLSVDALFEVGWPGEVAQPEAARARVYVALSSLRKAGLGACIQRQDSGWLLSVPIRLS
ncbi:MAG: hypothetical protein KC492_35545 [Myxococcales bacterium]|nr:hypothetical protein [Myxococcales bacterium]